jgi:hypothetical protein
MIGMTKHDGDSRNVGESPRDSLSVSDRTSLVALTGVRAKA